MELRDGVGAIDGVEKRVGKGVRLSEVLRSARNDAQGMVLGKRADRRRKRPQILFIRATPSKRQYSCVM